MFQFALALIRPIAAPSTLGRARRGRRSSFGEVAEEEGSVDGVGCYQSAHILATRAAHFSVACLPSGGLEKKLFTVSRVFSTVT